MGDAAGADSCAVPNAPDEARSGFRPALLLAIAVARLLSVGAFAFSERESLFWIESNDHGLRVLPKIRSPFSTWVRRP